MFIRWGLYSVPAGEWNGKRIEGLGEWIMNRGKILGKEYELLAPKFNPEKFNAEEIVRIAKNTGMRWPKPPDVMYFEEWPMRQSSLLFAGLALSRPGYIATWKHLPADSNVE